MFFSEEGKLCRAYDYLLIISSVATGPYSPTHPLLLKLFLEPTYLISMVTHYHKNSLQRFFFTSNKFY